MALTKVTEKIISDNLSVSGVVTASNFKTGVSNLHDIGIDVGAAATIRSTGNASFTGIVTAQKFVGDISEATGAAAGLGTALSQTQTNPLNKIYYTDSILSVGSTITIDPPVNASAAYTQYTDIVADGADIIVADGDDFIPDVLGLTTTGSTPPVYSGSGGRIRAGSFTNVGANGAPTAPNGWIVTGVNTATTLNVTGNATIDGNLGVGGVITYEDVARVDAVGLSTFREGFGVGPLAGIALTAYKDGSIRSTGIITATNVSVAQSVTATTYYGSGANLTGISAGVSTEYVSTQGLNVVGVSTFNDNIEVNSTNSKRFYLMKDGSDEFSLYDSGGTAYITHKKSASNLQLQTNHIVKIGSAQSPWRTSAKFQPSGDVELFSSNDCRFKTNAYGVEVKGNSGSNLEGGRLDITNATTSNWSNNAWARITNDATNGVSQFQFWTQASGGSLTERLRIGSTGNLALGTTNTDGGSGHTNIFLGGMGNIYAETTASNSASLSTSNNAYIPSSGGWKYRTGGRASNIYHYDGGIGFRYAASGSAGGAITWSESYKIRNDGSVFFKIPNTNYDTTAGIILSNYTDGSRNVTPGTLICSTTDIPFIANLSDSNDGIVAVWRKGGSSKGNVSISGNNTAYNQSSDYRLKENVVNITDGITRVKQLNPRRFNWISDETNTLQDGFLAHEVTPVVPEAVTGEKDADPGPCGMGYQQMDHSKLVPLLTAALQEAVNKIETLETDVGNLKLEVANLALKV